MQPDTWKVSLSGLAGSNGLTPSFRKKTAYYQKHCIDAFSITRSKKRSWFLLMALPFFVQSYSRKPRSSSWSAQNCKTPPTSTKPHLPQRVGVPRIWTNHAAEQTDLSAFWLDNNLPCIEKESTLFLRVNEEERCDLVIWLNKKFKDVNGKSNSSCR